ncbi:MAG: diguanylate cyclase [Marinobacter sp.]|nr:diguanylate cyclase [Marinobacter sp.]MDX1635170.1 diguanylate cyclase [Marinobacter sp.]
MDAVCVVDREGYLLFVSAAGERIFGYKPAEMIGRRILDFVYPQDLEKTLASANKVLSGSPQLDFENRYLRKDGTIAHIMWSARYSEADGVRIGVARDVTERRHSESMRAALYAISEAATASPDLASLFARIHPVVQALLPATSFTLALCEPATGELSLPYSARPEGALAGRRLAEAESICRRVVSCRRAVCFGPAGAGATTFSSLGVPMETGTGVIGALALQSEVEGDAYSQQDRELVQFVAVQLAAATERIEMQARMERLAQYDQLTGLPNRALFSDRLQTALARARRQQSRLALLFLDLNDFKTINDTYGHAVGDQLLQAVATRLSGSIRDMDTAGRMGGDEFVVLLETVEQADDARQVAEKLKAVLHEPYHLAGLSLRRSPSIGWAVYPEDGDDSDSLIRHADHAMYRVKRGAH